MNCQIFKHDSNSLKPFLRLFMISLLSFLFGCSRSDIREGGLYCTPAEQGGYSILKILKIDEAGVHIRAYSNHYAIPPKKIDEAALYMVGVDRKPEETLGLGHVPISKKSFSQWKIKFVQQSSVREEELEGFNMWLEAEAGYFDW